MSTEGPTQERMTDPVERLVVKIHQMNGMEEFCELVSNPEIRLRVRDTLGANLPGVERYKVEEDKFFLLFLNGLRMAYDGRDDYNDRIRQMAVVLYGSRDGAVPARTEARPAEAPVAAAETAPETQPRTPHPAVAEPAPPAVATPAQAAKTAAPALALVGSAPAQVSSAAMTELTLFQARPPERPGHLVALLGPPPAKGCLGNALSAWLAGVPASLTSVAVRLDGHGVADQLAECEAELRSDPDGYLSRSGVRRRLKARGTEPGGDWMKHHASWLSSVVAQSGHDVSEKAADGMPGVAAIALRDALERVIDGFEPSLAGRMKGAGAKLVIPEGAEKMIATAIALEDQYLDELCDEPGERAAQNYLGAVSERGEISRGIVLDRAMTCHFVIGIPLDNAVALALLELRCAQALRLAGPESEGDVFQQFDERFFADCRQPLSGYMMVSEDPIPEP